MMTFLGDSTDFFTQMLTLLPSTLFEGASNELAVYLGPWEVVESETRRVVWQCSYQGEVLEQFRACGLAV